MEREAALLARIKARFPEIETDQAAVAPRRIFLTVPEALCLEVLRHAKAEMGFGHLCAITGLDTGEGFEFLYHIADEAGVVMSVKFLTGGREDVSISSVLPVYEGATFYERELEGLLGVRVEGLPEGRQYPLPDDWPKGQYPLRKDWQKQG